MTFLSPIKKQDQNAIKIKEEIKNPIQQIESTPFQFFKNKAEPQTEARINNFLNWRQQRDSIQMLNNREKEAQDSFPSIKNKNLAFELNNAMMPKIQNSPVVKPLLQGNTLLESQLMKKQAEDL